MSFCNFIEGPKIAGETPALRKRDAARTPLDMVESLQERSN
jgi:hypothetical protein